MLRLQKKLKTYTATINDNQTLDFDANETILSAALRHGIDFPNLCKVGGCGTCKCQLLAGDVVEMTETGYLLSEEEIAGGYILACQSRPTTDIKIAVDLRPTVKGQPVLGRVIRKEMLTHDIARIDVKLEKRIDFRAGQFAELIHQDLPDAPRNYSFSSAPESDRTVSFTIRKVPGGLFSSKIIDEDIVGSEIKVRGPGGEFWLRPGFTPVIMVAGGSGLAPIIGMLKEAAQRGEARPVTLLFGARTQRDLYYLNELRTLEKTWPTFKFVPVLSDADNDKNWKGARGLVTKYIAEFLSTSASAYLCGPPPMVDAAEQELIRLGMQKNLIRADRFHVRKQAAENGFSGEDALPPVMRPKANLGDYLKFALFHLVGIFSAGAILAGGLYSTLGALAVLAFFVIGDILSGDDERTPRFSNERILTVSLWMAMPVLAFIVFNAIWSISPGDPFGYGAWLSRRSGYDILAAKALTTGWHSLSVYMLTGLMIGMIGTIPAHELTHRTWDPVSMFFGRWLLAFSFDTAFSIEHVYGHHRYVSTAHDPATAPRGRNVYYHIIASTIQGNLSAWKIEAARLKRKKLSLLSFSNAYLRGQVMSLCLLVAAFLIGGWLAALYFFGLALFGKAMLEIVNYMEHYGMVRLEDQPVQPRHSWNTNARLTSWSMFNLNRHSHHHAQGEVPFQNLLPLPEAPNMIGGYLSTMLITLVPPVWNYLMKPKLREWDERFATPQERELVRKANQPQGRLNESPY